MVTGDVPRVEDLPRLQQTKRVLAESLRLYPPAWGISRRATHDVELGPCTVPAGAIVLMSQYVTHRDARFFPDPSRFDPQRWDRGSRVQPHPRWAYFPFGGGPRRCIGETFAGVEGVLMIATIARRWRMRVESGDPVRLMPLISLRPRDGMRMTLYKRRPGAGASGVGEAEATREVGSMAARN